ncbi:MAG: ribosomal RNA small subunit methyltransferase A [Verrucomicrobiaceae bacterium]|nr:ribosomal RNA small subunit methyltransferase A [Verrucomicrobiaceae bacterium]
MDINGQLSPSQTLELLKQLEHSPVKKLGQNFLVDSNIVRKSLELADVKKDDVVVEVGPGLGTLSGALLQAGAKVYAVELDKTLHAYLKEHFSQVENFSLINADAVEYPLASLPDEVSDFKIVANLPYAISTPWLDKVLSDRLPSMMSLMLQKEAALRFAAVGGSKEFSPISICLSEAYDVSARHKVSASCFHPRPAVDSVLLALKRKECPFVFKPKTKEIMRYVFSKRRKQMLSIAKSAGEFSELLLAWLEQDKTLSPDIRPERIDSVHWKIFDGIVK